MADEEPAHGTQRGPGAQPPPGAQPRPGNQQAPRHRPSPTDWQTLGARPATSGDRGEPTRLPARGNAPVPGSRRRPPGEQPGRGTPQAPATRPPAPRQDAAARRLQLQPMVHVADLAASVAFYERLGGELIHGSRDGDWVLMQLGMTQIGLLAHPPNAEEGECAVELNFAASMPLDELERRLRGAGVTIAEIATDRDFGEQLRIMSPDGLLVKINQIEPDVST
jgi:catechol 2,3-dioxygenase-like lactoylglutathione lyase family enzyme